VTAFLPTARQAGRRAHDNPLTFYANPLRQAISASTWRSAWFLICYLAVSWVLFSVALTVSVTAATLAITVVALPLLITAAKVIHWCADVERRRLRRAVGHQVSARYTEAAAGTSLRTRASAYWTDRATWRDLGYLTGLWVPLYTLDTVVIAIWGWFLSWITMPLWYWAPWLQYHGHRIHGYQLGFYFPHGPDGPGTIGIFVDTLPKAVLVAVAGLVGFLIFNYVLVATARMHARVANAMLRPPADPLAEAKDVLSSRGPLGRLTQDVDALSRTGD
jgi:hypothetical protein